MQDAAVGQPDSDADERRIVDDVPIRQHIELAAALDDRPAAGFVERLGTGRAEVFGVAGGFDVNDVRLDELDDPFQDVAVLFECRHVARQLGKKLLASGGRSGPLELIAAGDAAPREREAHEKRKSRASGRLSEIRMGGGSFQPSSSRHGPRAVHNLQTAY